MVEHQPPLRWAAHWRIGGLLRLTLGRRVLLLCFLSLPQRLDEYSQASQEEREEMYGEGGPFAPFMGMLQVGRGTGRVGCRAGYGGRRLGPLARAPSGRTAQRRSPAADCGQPCRPGRACLSASPCCFGLPAQFALEALAVPAEQPTSAGEVARGLPPALKLLRTLKFCEDTSVEPRTQVGRHRVLLLGKEA